jgi:hypothetical protein
MRIGGEPLTHYLQLVKSKSYTYSKHIAPHDAAVHEYSTKVSRVEVARNHGIVFTIAPDIALIEGIDAVSNDSIVVDLMKLSACPALKHGRIIRRNGINRHGCWSSCPPQLRQSWIRCL